jgi:hypothetical protein
MFQVQLAREFAASAAILGICGTAMSEGDLSDGPLPQPVEYPKTPHEASLVLNGRHARRLLAARTVFFWVPAAGAAGLMKTLAAQRSCGK